MEFLISEFSTELSDELILVSRLLRILAHVLVRFICKEKFPHRVICSIPGRGSRGRPSGSPGWKVRRQLKHLLQDPERRRFDRHLRLRVDDQQRV